jgi:hypothetical protein
VEKPVARITLHHLTRYANLPLIEADGIKTRAELTDRHGPLTTFDTAATGVYAFGKRVSAYPSKDGALAYTATYGGGYVTFDVDPTKTLAQQATVTDAEKYWQTARPLSAWLSDGPLPDDLDVHTPVAVRAKRCEIKAPLVTDEELGVYAPLVHAVADTDRLAAKALMHLAVIATGDNPDTPVFAAACALAWRDTQDSDAVLRELAEYGAARLASAALAEHGVKAPDAARQLRDVLDEVRAWGSENGMEEDEAIRERTIDVLAGL